MVDVVGHQQIGQCVQRQCTEEPAPFGHVAGQPSHHGERGDTQVLDIEHALHVGQRVVVDVNAGGKRLRVHEEQHAQQRRHRRIDQADADPFPARPGGMNTRGTP